MYIHAYIMSENHDFIGNNHCRDSGQAEIFRWLCWTGMLLKIWGVAFWAWHSGRGILAFNAMNLTALNTIGIHLDP